jgi:hypothetical protein
VRQTSEPTDKDGPELADDDGDGRDDDDGDGDLVKVRDVTVLIRSVGLGPFGEDSHFGHDQEVHSKVPSLSRTCERGGGG